MTARMELLAGDITRLTVDVIVTAANEALAGGHGVDGAVHRAAGPRLFAECQTLRYCAEGDAKITGAYDLAARHVIHTVGPIWEGGDFGEPDRLRSCYLNSLRLASEHQARTIAFPCIATGAHEFPSALACEIAVNTVSAWLDQHPLPQSVIFCCYEQLDFELYEKQLASQASRSAPVE